VNEKVEKQYVDSTMRLRIQKDLENLFDLAETQKLWFWSRKHDLWFSPDDLKELQSTGRFVWGKDNWELRDPREKLDRLKRLAKNSANDVKEFEKRIINPTGE